MLAWGGLYVLVVLTVYTLLADYLVVLPVWGVMRTDAAWYVFLVPGLGVKYLLDAE